ncbi:MAG: argininosuccinate lyase [Spirochaetes bacterium GWD1_27_9]|nr:MAG: argininosuccinate lyase [Spirochaetes bacterium GWB1_27_13]OHD25380.1 MAG: argininosuccinate lyase [Spirochaetes bacterium GWC1_27_15]OHD30300.1 MAG: argininosuccinate lyase [Spirochaetes bacterium GWD1_27_9]
MKSVLWEKGDKIDMVMQELTVGNDHILDKEMVIWDCIGSAAHARMLCSIGILTKADTESLLSELKNIYALGKDKKIDIPANLEDVHNVIETMLVEKVGEVGMKIHAGRSRNDQILVTTRLHLRNMLLEWLQSLSGFLQICFVRYTELKDVLMPGFTHMQPAMPSSVGMWLHAFIENSLELISEGLMLLKIINVNPLGASAGFSSNIPLDREYTTNLLEFSRVQRSSIDCNNSRGRFEEKVLHFGANIAGLFEKMACDIMLYTTREYGFFSLPTELTTGSSIMPQKKNCDIVELLRGRGAKIRASALEVVLITAKLPSSYNRDYQYTKEPVIRTRHELGEMFRMAYLVISRFQVNKDRLAECMYPDLYSTYEANRLCQSGVPYRKAYRMIAEKLRNGTYDKKDLEGDFLIIATQTEKYLKEAKQDFDVLQKEIEIWAKKFESIEKNIFSV